MSVFRRVRDPAREQSSSYHSTSERAARRASWTEKGKMRARDEGSGGPDGVVLDLDMVGDGVWEAIYTAPVQIGGSNPRTYQLQVDTGSADLWVASTSCSSSSCGGAKGHQYDPSAAAQTGKTFNISYLAGGVTGPVVWDAVSLGGYSLDNQALAAASDVEDEPLTSGFSGILGLALPLDSVIAGLITPTTSDAPDGATLGSNLFSITPTGISPSSRFFSLTLDRPGSDRIPATLGIGRHPSGVVSDVSRISYGRVLPDASGATFWRTQVRGISVWVNGKELVVDTGRSHSGAVFPSALLDSGIPVILSTSTIANGIYGALGIGPGSDGKYYVPCTTPLNMSITLGTTPSVTIPLHPLDLTAYPQSDSSSPSSMTTCLGMIQTADEFLTPVNSVGDLILGVPFLRNVYTVLAYAAPNANGTFGAVAAANSQADPRLGLLPLTDPSVAMSEFMSVRVQHQPLGGGNSGSGQKADAKGHGLSVGLKVLAGVGGFFALCAILFSLWWFVVRRRIRRANAVAAAAAVDDKAGGDDKYPDAYVLGQLRERADSRGTTSTKIEASVLSESTLRSTTPGDAPKHGRSLDGPGDGATGASNADEQGQGVNGGGGRDSFVVGSRHIRAPSDEPLLGVNSSVAGAAGVGAVAAVAADEMGRRPGHTRAYSGSGSPLLSPPMRDGRSRAPIPRPPMWHRPQSSLTTAELRKSIARGEDSGIVNVGVGEVGERRSSIDHGSEY